jgi:hypothetical protein
MDGLENIVTVRREASIFIDDNIHDEDDGHQMSTRANIT